VNFELVIAVEFRESIIDIKLAKMNARPERQVLCIVVADTNSDGFFIVEFHTPCGSKLTGPRYAGSGNFLPST